MTSLVQTTDIHHTNTAGISFVSLDSLMIAAGVIVASDSNIGVDTNFTAVASLVNHGDIEAGNIGVFVSQSISTVINEADGLITGDLGVSVDGTADFTWNFGSVTGNTTGFLFGTSSQSSSLDNRGSIFGESVGVEDHSGLGGLDAIKNSGTLEGGVVGIDIDTAAGLVTLIANSGTIQGGSWSVHGGSGSAGAVHLTNTGSLIGDVSLESNQNDADAIINSGHILGQVSLGGGNDSFIGTGGTSGEVFGEAGGDHLVGGSGADRLSGGLGNDTLTGGPGSDHFVFDAALNASTNVDRITDFHHGVDKIDLSHAIFTAAGSLGTLKAAAFFAGTAAHDASDRIIYNPANGFVSYDADGTGHAHAQIHFATLAPHLTLTNTDFLVVA